MDRRSRLASFEQLLSPNAGRSARARDNLRELARGGIPDEPSRVRAASWRILLNVPENALEQYFAFVHEITARTTALPAPGAQLLKQDRVLVEIERDVVRTFGGLAWFAGEIEGDSAEEDGIWGRLRLLEEAEVALRTTPTLALQPPPEAGDVDSAVSIPTTPTTPSHSTSAPLSTRPRNRRESLLRPLFIFATLNPGLSYQQGMQSLAAILLWVFSNGGLSHREAEATTFFALGAILSQLRDLYVQALDGPIPSLVISPVLGSGTGNQLSAAPSGLGDTLGRFTHLLTWLDPDLAYSLASKQIEPSLYVFRWITTLFANEFSLPDLVKIWDRLFTLVPAEDDPPSAQALTPLLGHLLDLSIAIVLTERPLLCSPFSDFTKCLTILQDPQIEGAGVDRMLGIAWEIRERRLARTPGKSSGAGSQNWSDLSKRWTSAALAASSGPTANSFRDRFFPSTPSPVAKFRRAVDRDQDDAGDISFASQSSRGEDEPPLPPSHSPDQVRSPLPPLPSKDENESEPGEGDSENDTPTLATRAAASWGSWKSSMSRLASSDVAASISKTTTNYRLAASDSLSRSANRYNSSDTVAALSKTTTNLSLQAQLLREQVAEQAPGRLAAIRETVTAASGRFMATTDGEGTSPRNFRRPGSPVLEPFTPPRWGDSSSGRRSPAPSSLDGPGGAEMVKRNSGSSTGGPRPLLLSASARRAGSQDGTSPPASRRTSILFAPSSSGYHASPTPGSMDRLSKPTTTTTPLSRSHSGRTTHGRTVSAVHPPSPSTPQILLHARSASTDPASASSEVEFPPRTSSRDVLPQQLSVEIPPSIPNPNGRGWTLTDVSPARSVVSQTSSSEFHDSNEMPLGEEDGAEAGGVESSSSPVLETPRVPPTGLNNLRRQTPSLKARSSRGLQSPPLPSPTGLSHSTQNPFNTTAPLFSPTLPSPPLPPSEVSDGQLPTRSGLGSSRRGRVSKRATNGGSSRPPSGSGKTEDWDEDNILDGYV